ncbi:MAG: DUF4349 domain-containing protein [Polyangiales bacterium]
MRFLSRLSLLLSPLLFVACGGASKSYAYRTAPAAGAAAPPPAYGSYPPPGENAPVVAKEESGGYVAQATPGTAVETTVVAQGDVGTGTTGGGGAPPPPPPPTPVEPQQQGAVEMFDIEARMSIEVDKVSEAAGKVRDIVKKNGGQIVADTVTDDSGSTGATFTIRVPSKGSEAFLNELGGVGAVRSRQVTARDIGKEFHDAQIYLRNLEAALKRYEEILAKAKDVKEILEIEREMTRIRSQIDHVKGDLRWMKDRAARATIYVTIYATRPEGTTTFNPQAKVYPGVRGAYLADFRGEGGNAGYLGAGLSVSFSRYFGFEVDGYRALTSPSSGLDLFMVTAGGELYSDFLGAGKRTWLNPYVGLRVGYQHMLGKDEMVAGGTFGLEIYKTKVFRLDAAGRILGMFANKNVGGHIAVSPTISMHVAF